MKHSIRQKKGEYLPSISASTLKSPRFTTPNGFLLNKHNSGALKFFKDIITKIDSWINEKIGYIRSYNRMLIMALAYLIGIILRTFIFG